MAATTSTKGRQAARDAAADATSTKGRKPSARQAAKAATDDKAAKAVAKPTKAPTVPPKAWPGRTDQAGSFVRYARQLRRNGHFVVGFDTAAASTKAEQAMVSDWRKAGLPGRFVVLDMGSDEAGTGGGLAASADVWATVYATTCAWGEGKLAPSVGTAAERRDRGVLPAKAEPKADEGKAEPTKAAKPKAEPTKATPRKRAPRKAAASK